MAGCFRGSIYSAAKTIGEYLQRRRLTRFVQCEVTIIDPPTETVRLGAEGGEQEVTGFSKIFRCAGCHGSTEILMRSTGLSRASNMADNSAYVFPILYMGKVEPKEPNEPYLLLCNLILGVYRSCQT